MLLLLLLNANEKTMVPGRLIVCSKVFGPVLSVEVERVDPSFGEPCDRSLNKLGRRCAPSKLVRLFSPALILSIGYAIGDIIEFTGDSSLWSPRDK